MSNAKKNYLYQVFYQILISILPFVTSPYIARVLGAEGVGIYSYTYSIITYFRIFAALGILNYGNRAVAQAKDDREKLNRTFSSLFALHFLLSGVVLVIYLVYWNAFVTQNRMIALIQIIYLVSELLDINWFYFGMEKFKLTVVRNCLLKIATVVAVFLFVKATDDLWKYVLIMAVGNLVSTAAVWVFLPRFARFVKFSIKEMLQHLKPMIVLFFAVIAASVYTYMDKIMLGAMSAMDELGYYENACKMIEFPVGFITALGTVMLPKISNLVTKGDNKAIDHYVHDSMRFSMVTSVAIAFGMAGIAKEFAVVFWGEGFATSGTLMTVMAVIVVIMSWNTVIRTQHLIPRGYDKVYLLAVSCGAVVNLIVNYLLIPQFGSVGAAIGTIMAYLGICVVQTCYVAKSLPLGTFFTSSIPYVAVGLVMFIGVRTVGSYMGATVVGLVVEVIVGIVLFCSLALFYAMVSKDEFILKKAKLVKDIVLRKSVKK